MRAGDLKNRVLLQVPGTDRDVAGQPIPGQWTELDEVWASIKYLNGKQYITSNAEANSATASILIRRRDGLVPTMRVVYGSTIFDVVALLPDEENRDRVYLACTTGVNNG